MLLCMKIVLMVVSPGKMYLKIIHALLSNLFLSEGGHKIACIKIEESINDGMASLGTM